MQLLPPLASFIATFIGIKLMLKFFPKLGLLDRPASYGLKRAPIPYSGGVIFFMVFLIGTLVFVDITNQILGVILAAFLVTYVSFSDDRIQLSPWLRLAVQVLAGALVVLSGVKIQIIANPFGPEIHLDQITFNFLGRQIWLLSAVFIVFWLVLMMNVMNWLDGIPGLSSGVSTIAQIAIFILASQQFNIVDQSAIKIISSILAASTLVFLFFDFPKPKILMGDSGSMFLGFILGILAILSGGKLATALLIMGFPVLDAFWVILKRILTGKSPGRGDFSHFHHRLLRAGFSERKALIFNYVLCAVLAAIALVLHSTFHKFVAFLAVFVLMAAVGGFLFIRDRRF